MLALERQVTPASRLLDVTAREIHEVGEATVVFDANQAASLMAHAADNFAREIHPTNTIDMVIASSIEPLKYSDGHLALESEIAIEVDVAYPPFAGADFRTEVL